MAKKTYSKIVDEILSTEQHIKDPMVKRYNSMPLQWYKGYLAALQSNINKSKKTVELSSIIDWKLRHYAKLMADEQVYNYKKNNKDFVAGIIHGYLWVLGE